MNQTKWSLDPSHSELQFKVKHLMITTVTGKFKDFEVSAFTAGDDFSSSEIHALMKTESVDSGNQQRDEHLKSGDFFNSAQFPAISFTSKSLKRVNGSDTFEINGDLTIKDITKQVSLNASFAGIAKDPYGNLKAGFSIEGLIQRKEFGLDWNVPVDSGMLVGDQVKISAEIQLVKSS
jgi:polyisoprenoid-binding protein YceI